MVQAARFETRDVLVMVGLLVCYAANNESGRHDVKHRGATAQRRRVRWEAESINMRGEAGIGGQGEQLFMS